jgi:transcriptional regulator with XRE-family HTH domain
MCRESGAPRGSLTDLKMGRTTNLTTETLSKISTYFGVSIDSILGNEQEKTPTPKDERKVTDKDIKIALFGGDGEVTDEMWEEALFAAQLIKDRHKRKKDNND